MTEYELVMEEQVNFVMSETVAGQRTEVCMCVCVHVHMCVCVHVCVPV